MFTTHKRHTFTPDKLGTNLVYWITARDITIDGKASFIKDGSNRVSQINDLSPWNNHVSQSSGALQPLLVESGMGNNNQPYYDFNGGCKIERINATLTPFSNPSNGPRNMGSIFVVFEHTSDTTLHYFYLRYSLSTVQFLQIMSHGTSADQTTSVPLKNRIGHRFREGAFTVSNNETDLINGQQLIVEITKPNKNSAARFTIDGVDDGVIGNSGVYYNSPNRAWLWAQRTNNMDILIGNTTPVKLSEIIITNDINNRSKENIYTYLKKTYDI